MTGNNFKNVLPIAAMCLFFLPTGTVEAAYFVDNGATGCWNGATTYNPSNRTCAGGTDTVYLSLSSASASGGGTALSQKVFNIRQGTTAVPAYKETFSVPSYTTWQKYPSDPNKPIIDGEYQRPANRYENLLTITDCDYVEINGLVFQHAANATNFVEGGRDEGWWYRDAIGIVRSTYITIRNCDFKYLGGNATQAYSTSGRVCSHLLYEDNYVLEANLEVRHGNGGYGSALRFLYGTSYSTMRRNTLAGCFGEAITDLSHEFFETTHDNVIEYNTIIDCGRVSMLIDGTYNTTIRYNLIYNPRNDPRYTEGNGDFSRLGIEIMRQYAGRSNVSNVFVHGNMVVGASTGIDISRHPGNCESTYSNIDIFNNTVIESWRSGAGLPAAGIGFYNLGCDGYSSDIIGSGVEIKNNIIWQTTGDVVHSYQANVADIDWDNNLWSRSPNIGGSATDPRNGNYGSSINISDYVQKQTGWTNLAGTTLTPNDFKLRTTATYAIDKGANLGSPYNSDYFGNLQSGAWDIGAMVYGGTSGAVCGNGVVETGEACDNGSNNGVCPQACSASCTINSCDTGNEIPKTNWTLHYVDSEELTNEYAPATYAFDNNANTFWHTPWEASTQPHETQINLNGNYNLTGMRYLPRQDGSQNGTIKNYEFYTSTDGTNWTQKSSGAFASDTAQKEISFTQTTARYIRLRSTSEINGGVWTSAAEITLLGTIASGDTTAPAAPGGLSVR